MVRLIAMKMRAWKRPNILHAAYNILLYQEKCIECVRTFLARRTGINRRIYNPLKNRMYLAKISNLFYFCREAFIHQGYIISSSEKCVRKVVARSMNSISDTGIGTWILTFQSNYVWVCVLNQSYVFLQLFYYTRPYQGNG